MAEQFRQLTWLSLLAALCLLVGAGCGGQGLYPLQGQVEFEDGGDVRPLAGYLVMMDEPTLGLSCVAEIREDGSFTATTHQDGDGAAVGDYVVAITPAAPIGEALPPKSVLDPRYASPATSGLTISVLPEPNRVTLRVKRAP